MKRLIITGIGFILMLSLFLFSTPGAWCKTEATNEQLWSVTFKQYLSDPLWIERDAYDAGHFLMVPLHAAFWLNKKDWIDGFHHHVVRFYTQGQDEYEKISNILIRLHYLYFLSRYLVLAETTGDSSLIPDGLAKYVYDELEYIWYKPAWQWDRQPFPGGMKERLLWKLNSKNVSASYYRAIIDEELFVFAIAADLSVVSVIKLPLLQEIMSISYLAIEQEGVFNEKGGWLLQPGVWTDAPSYAYVGHEVIAPNLKEKPIKGIAWDTSHSIRWPVWLLSYLNAYPEGSKEYNLYLKIGCCLANQFHSFALVPPSNNIGVYRTVNYMDGNNGIYGYSYSLDKGIITAYGPYELSGTLLLGWWVFLNSGREWDVYNSIAQSFPMSQKVIDVYFDRNTTRERHPLVEKLNPFINGTYELISRLAVSLAPEPCDINKDRIVDLQDFFIIAANFGKESSSEACLTPDVNRDGIVNILDLVIVIQHIVRGKSQR